MYFAHRIHTPPMVYTIPAVKSIILGLLRHQFMVGMINWIMKPNGAQQNVDVVIQTYLLVVLENLGLHHT